MRHFACGISAAIVLIGTAASGQEATPRPDAGAPGPQTGLTREELLRKWDLDGDGIISQSEADLARARMRRERSEMVLDSGIDPITGLRRDEADLLSEVENKPRYRLPPELPTDATLESADQTDNEKRPGTRPRPMSELLAPISSTPPTPGLPRMPMMKGEPSSKTTPSPVERSGRASWLPPTKTGPTGIGGPRAGAPPAVPGYGASAWSDLNAGRLRATQFEAGKASANAGRTTGTGGGLLPTVRQPGRTGALILPGQTDPRLAPLAPSAPVAPRLPTFSPPRITAEDIGGYGP